MTVTDQIKILNRKIKENETQYDFDRKAAEISALSSNNLMKIWILSQVLFKKSKIQIFSIG